MAVTLTIAGTSFSYPNGTDTEWGDDTTNAMVAVAGNAIWKDGSVALTADWDAGSFKITAETFESDVVTGTAPLTVASTTKVDNLQAASVEGTGVKSTGESNGKVLTANGSDGATWETSSGGGDIITDGSNTYVDVGVTGQAGRVQVNADGTNTIAVEVDVDAISSQDGGDIRMTAGESFFTDATGGDILLTGGASTGGGSPVGGSVKLVGGAGDGDGGVVRLDGGTSDTNGGNIQIEAGVGTSQDGSITIGTETATEIDIGDAGTITTINGDPREARLEAQPANNTVPLAIATTQYVIDNAGGGGGSAADFLSDFPAGSWDLPESDFAEWQKDTGTNGFIISHRFDDTTEEQVVSYFKVPPDADTSGTVTFYIEGYAMTAAASKNVEFTFYHSAKSDGENWDAAFSSKVSGDLATDSTQDNMDFFSFTETFTTLGWAVGDNVRIKLGRTAPSANNLVGDYGLTNFRIRIPRA